MKSVPFCLHSIRGETAFKVCRSQTVRGSLTGKNLFSSPSRIEVVSNIDVVFGVFWGFFLFCAERQELYKHDSLDESSVLIASRRFALSTFIIILMAKKTQYVDKKTKKY